MYRQWEQYSRIFANVLCRIATILNPQVFISSIPCSALVFLLIHHIFASHLFLCPSDPSRLRFFLQSNDNHSLRRSHETLSDYTRKQLHSYAGMWRSFLCTGRSLLHSFSTTTAAFCITSRDIYLTNAFLNSVRFVYSECLHRQ